MDDGKGEKFSKTKPAEPAPIFWVLQCKAANNADQKVHGQALNAYIGKSARSKFVPLGLSVRETRNGV
jgi:hypothetical protein